MKKKSLLLIAMCLVFVAGLATQAVAAPLRQTVSAISQQSTLLVNGEQHSAQSLNYQNTTYVPLRKIAELFGANVHWDSKTQTIRITSTPAIPPADEPQDPSVPTQPEDPQQPQSGTEPVFPGYFKNVDYSKPEVFLSNGEQTKANSEIRAIAAQFNDKKDLSTLKEIFRWTNLNLRYGPGEKFGRTSAQIIGSRIATGCTDYGLAFATLAREKGIPTVFLQTARIDWIQDLVAGSSRANSIRGHILVEVFVDGNWYLVDSTAGKLFLDYDKNNLSLCDGCYIFAKSIEVWDSGVLDERGNTQAMRSLFRTFDPSRYQNPKYDYIDLLSGSRKASGDFPVEQPTPQPNDSTAAVLGLQAPVEKFGPRFGLGGPGVAWAGFEFISQERFEQAATMVLLTYSGESYPDYMLKAVPRLNDQGEFYCSYSDNGKRIIIVKAASEEGLMQLIDTLPGDILTQDY